MDRNNRRHANPFAVRVSIRPLASGFQTIGYTEINLLDQDLTGVVITPFNPAQVRVRVVIECEEDKPLTAGSVFLIQDGDSTGGMNPLTQYEPQNAEKTSASVGSIRN